MVFVVKRLRPNQIKDARKSFWIVWTVLVTTPLSVGVMLLAEGSWWGSPLAAIISTVVGHNVFEEWLRRRQRTADNTIVLCECGHSMDVHATDRLMHCLEPLNERHRGLSNHSGCLCLRYAPRFWVMSNHT